MAKQRWLKKFTGEISKLRQAITGMFGTIVTGQYMVPYALNSTRVNYELARKLYYNTADDYKLGAGFAKPVVNTLAGFMGVPRLHSQDENAQAILDIYNRRWVSKMLRTHQLMLRDGDCFVLLANVDNFNKELYPDEDSRLEYIIIPPEQVTEIILDPVTRQPVQYVIQSRCKWGDNREREYSVKQTITKDQIITELEGDVPPGIESGVKENRWGFIPIIHFKNEPEESELYGTSELEPIEPYLKAYHDVMLHAIRGSKLHSTPRLKLTLNNVEEFLRRNFGDTIIEQVRRGEKVKVNLEGHELLLFTENEDASFIEAKSVIGDTETLLKLLFYCIVDTSEIPEFAFGVHTPSSHASVKEQMPLLIRRVARKREMVTENWQLLGRMILVMSSKLKAKSDFASYDVEITWDPVVERDEKEFAETIKTLVDALDGAINAQIISQEAAVNLLAQYIDTMNEFVSDSPEIPGERERIVKTWIMRRRLEDGEQLMEENKKINQLLNEEEDQNE